MRKMLGGTENESPAEMSTEQFPGLQNRINLINLMTIRFPAGLGLKCGALFIIH